MSSWLERNRLISVVVPNLNEAERLPFFLGSLRRQKFKDFELVVVDGGSTDGSRGIIDGYRGYYDITGLVNFTRNIGFVRNLGAKCSRGDLLLFTNSDAVLPSTLLREIRFYFVMDDLLQALSGRTIPYEGGFLCFAGYFCFDRLRSFMARRLRRFSPSGNFLAIRKDLFWRLGGFPLASVNEDGLLGQRISKFCRVHGGRAVFDLDLSTGHFAKRWRSPLKTLLFYSYVFGNFSHALGRILAGLERRSGEAFNKK